MKSIHEASLITAIKTPFQPDGSIDLDAYDQLLQKQVDHGVDGIVVGGTTGEGQLMKWDEHIMLIAHSVRYFGDQLLVIGNTGSNNTAEAFHATKQGFAVGMHAALQINPYYGKTSIDALQYHFAKPLDVGPIIIYNVPGRTGQDIPPQVIEELAEHSNFLGVKECAGNERIAYYEQRNIACWSGNDDQSFEGRHQYQSHGVISVTANVVPKLMRQLMDVNDPSLDQRLTPLYSWLFSEPNPIPLNTALAMMGAAQPVFRLPYAPLNASQRQAGLEILRTFTADELVANAWKTLNDEDFLLIA